MSARWTPLAITYLVVAILGLIGTWTLNILAITQNSSFFGEWFSNGAATQSLQVDLLVLAVASGVFIVVEGRRLGMRRAWLFLPLAAVTAAAFAVPLFLAMRERRLAIAAAPAAER
ncbi:MAG: DUF2834 domain-containing protein [Microbacteriaceae bacterium]